MTIYELYFRSEYFKNIVDDFVRKHMTTYEGAFKCMEIKNAYKVHLRHLLKKGDKNTY